MQELVDETLASIKKLKACCASTPCLPRRATHVQMMSY